MNNTEGGGPDDRPPSTKKKRILAIDPGTRYMGMALLEGDALVYYGVKRIHHRGSPHERLTEGKREVAEAVAAIYPELKAYLPNGSGSAFRSNLFDAVAVGISELDFERYLTLE